MTKPAKTIDELPQVPTEEVQQQPIPVATEPTMGVHNGGESELTSETPITDKIQEALDDTRKTGNAHELRASKTGFFKEQPEAAGDPRMAITNSDTLIIQTEKCEELKASELHKLCCNNPDHHLAPGFRAAVLGLPKDQIVAVRYDQVRSLRDEPGKKLEPKVIMELPPQPNP